MLHLVECNCSVFHNIPKQSGLHASCIINVHILLRFKNFTLLLGFPGVNNLISSTLRKNLGLHLTYIFQWESILFNVAFTIAFKKVVEKLPSSYDLATPQPFWTLLYSIYYFVISILILLDSSLKPYIRGMQKNYPRYSNNIFGRVDTSMD